MMRRTHAAIGGLAAAIIACGGPGAHEPENDAGPVDAGSLLDAGPADAGMLSPIQWADLWIEGFYDAGFAGTNVYSNTDVRGAPNGYYTAWRDDPGVTLFSNVSDCSSFSDTLMTRAYGWTPPTTNPRPLAEDYYWAIRSGTRFTEITNVNDIAAGDTIALLYPPGSANTGHVAWIDAVPEPYSGNPVETGLSQYAVWVIDSDDGFHVGPHAPSSTADDRYLGLLNGDAQCSSDVQCITLYGPNALCNSTQLISDAVCSINGVGRGQMRIYTDSTGTIQGYSWDPNDYATFFPRPNPLPASPGAAFTGRDIVVGRYTMMQ